MRRTKEEEQKRLESMWNIESAFFEKGFKTIAGTDEAGRGPLAGDVYAAAVVLPKNLIIEGLNDSKKLSEKKREELYGVITSEAVAWAVGTASVAEIEEINIRNAAYLAMRRAIDGLSVKADFVLVDGNAVTGLDLPHECVVKGDSKSASIAAASIIAKVSRDRYMTELAKKYPQYGFEKHKGYGTAQHIEMIKKYGASDIHRKLFVKKFV